MTTCFNLDKTFQIQLALKFFVNSVKCFNRNCPRAQSKQNAPSTTKVSPATRNREIGIRTQSIAIRNRAIAADNRATRIYIRATATDSRGIGIYSQEIVTDSREIAADSQEMAVNIEEIAGYTRRNAAAAVRRLPAAGLAPVSARNAPFLPFAARRALNTLRP